MTRDDNPQVPSPSVLESRARAEREYQNDVRIHYTTEVILRALGAESEADEELRRESIIRVAMALIGFRDGASHDAKFLCANCLPVPPAVSRNVHLGTCGGCHATAFVRAVTR